MNKKLLSLAVAGAISVPMASPVLVSTAFADEGTGPTVYGRVRLGVQRDETSTDSNNWGIEDDSSRFGIRGTEDLGNGMNVFYRYEFAAGGAESNGADALTNRLAFVGLRGNFGALSFGRQTSGYYAITGSDFALGESYTGNYLYSSDGGFGDYSDLSSRNADSIRYEYSIGNLTLGGDLVLDQDDDADDINVFAGIARYDFGIATLFGGYVQSRRNNDVTVTGIDDAGLAVSEDAVNEFETEIWTVGASSNLTENIFVYGIYEDGDLDNKTAGNGGENGGADGKAAHAGIKIALNEKIDGFFSYDWIEDETLDNEDTDFYTFGGQYHISDRTRFYAEFEFKDPSGDGEETDRQIVGIRHDF